jgi:hypothetical protein
MSHGHHDRVTAFAGAWSTLLFIIISVVGTYFMSRVSLRAFTKQHGTIQLVDHFCCLIFV